MSGGGPARRATSTTGRAYLLQLKQVQAHHSVVPALAGWKRWLGGWLSVWLAGSRAFLLVLARCGGLMTCLTECTLAIGGAKEWFGGSSGTATLEI